MISKLNKLSENNNPLVEITLLKGEKTKISWGCLSALIEAKIASTYAKQLLKEENLILFEEVFDDKEIIEGECFDI